MNNEDWNWHSVWMGENWGNMWQCKECYFIFSDVEKSLHPPVCTWDYKLAKQIFGDRNE